MTRLNWLRGERLYLDSNIIIYGVEGFENFRAMLLDLFQAIRSQTVQAITSELTLAEVLVKPFAEKNSVAIKTYNELLQSRPSFEVLPVTRSILGYSARLRADLGVKLPDAIHLATALSAECQFFCTEDRILRTPPPLKLLRVADLARDSSQPSDDTL